MLRGRVVGRGLGGEGVGLGLSLESVPVCGWVVWLDRPETAV